MLFGRAGVDMALYKQGFKKTDDDRKLALAAAKLAEAGIWVDDASEQTIGQIAAKVRRMVKQHGIRLIILDYIQLVEQEGTNGMDRVREITKISRKIMALKKQLRVPWIVLAQMNRNIETSERVRKPVLSDLKDCGALEQDADWVLFLDKTPRDAGKRRDDEEGETDQEIIDRVASQNQWEWSRIPYRVDGIIAKHRDGPTGEVKFVFQKNLARLLDWHIWKVEHGVEQTKAGERHNVLVPPREELL
jgi:replicative DNA helicase